MLVLTFQVDNGSGHILGIKESLTMVLETWGDVKLLEVREVQDAYPEQIRLDV